MNYENLTNPQKSILYTEQYFKGTSINNLCGTILIKEKINFEKLIEAIHIFLRDNDSLRIHLALNDNQEFVQYVSEDYDFDTSIISLRNDKELVELENKMVDVPFSLVDSQLSQLQLFCFPDNSGGLIVKAHHLVCDACTASLIASKIITIYSALLKEEEPNLQPTSYLAYVQSEKEYLSSPKFEKDKAYWESVFDKSYDIGCIPSVCETSMSLCKADRKSFILPKDKVEQINDFCSQNKISIFNFFMALYAIYIEKLTNLEEFVIGTPILNRSTFIEKNTPGMFISTMPFKFSINPNSTFVDFAKGIAFDALSMFRHQKYPYPNVLEYIRSKNPSQPNLYDILISYQNTKTNRNNADVPYEVRWTFNHNTSDALDIHIFDMNDEGILNIAYDYQIAKFTDNDISYLHKRILNMIKQILSQEDLLILNIKVVTKEEENYIFNVLNNSSYQYDENLTLIDLFEDQVQKTPNHTAICYANTAYTYLQLQHLIDTIATKIADKGLFSKNICVIANKSIKTVASFLAIMKSGNCYIPIDPSYPKDRIDYILENSNSDMIICDKKFDINTNNSIILDDIECDNNATFHNLAKPNMLAYMIYTSGSTGNPKGVKIKHKNIVNTLIWRKNYYNFNDSVNVLQIPSFSFDSSVEDIYTPLISGSKLVIPNFEKIDPNIICELIESYGINHFLVVPSLYRILLSEKSRFLTNFKFITIAGESFNENLIKEHFEKLPNVRLVNEYGPTENSVCSTFYEFSKENTHIYIGKPINNCKCFVLNSNLNLLPPNTTGELYLTGIGLSDGYLNRDDLTSEKFLTNNPLASRLYKTGDLVKYNLDYGLEFIGRNDSQIKLNGFRIELQEISNVILKYNFVKEAICLLKKLSNGKDILVAYITTTKGFELEYLNTMLRSSLPYYMIPKVVVLNKFPTTPNGKIDTKSLPLPAIEENHIHKEPKNELEKKILDICLEIVPNKNLHIDDDLFSVGLADSLMILTISSRLFAENIKIPTQYFYQYPTIEKLVANKDQIFKEVLDNTEIPQLKYKTDTKYFNFDELVFPYNNIFLTGATGFLGVHILYNLLLTTNANILCLVRRKSGVSPQDRLQELFIHYFGNEYISLFESRVLVLEGELNEPNFKLNKSDYNKLTKCDCVIHTAAITKHYGDMEIFYNSNILSTQNIVEFCKKHNIILQHMSTISIGDTIGKANSSNKTLTENDFYIGQNYKNNVYINSKFLSEAIIYKEQYNGLKANVFRLGNLMGRYSDGMFQINKYQNAFYTKLLALTKLKLVPNNMKNIQLDFSPIDTVSRSILALLSIPNLKNCIFHITNPNTISVLDLIDILSNLGISLNIVDTNSFIEVLSNNTNLMKYFVSDLSLNELYDLSNNTLIENNITNNFLKLVHFEWPKIDKDYLLRFFTKTDFFNDILK